MEPEQRDAWAAKIAEATEAAVDTKAKVENLVIAARKAGASWAVIGRGVGTTAQAAHERFTKLVEIIELEEASQR